MTIHTVNKESTLLAAIMDDLIYSYENKDLFVVDVALGGPFIVIRLSNGEIGSSLNFFVQNDDKDFDPTLARQECLKQSKTDPLLRNWACCTDYLRCGVVTAVATALSQRFLCAPRENPLRVENVTNWQNHFAKRVRRNEVICQVGFGGTVDIFARPGVVSEFVVCDFFFSNEHERKEALKVMKMRGLDPDCVKFQVSVFDSSILETADVVCISGSTLCNATLDVILAGIGQARIVVLQGPSCSIYAPSLFHAGITSIYAPIKRSAEWQFANLRASYLNDYVDGDYVVISRDM